MSDEDISKGEDKENLMYIFRQISVERSQHEDEDHSERASVISTDSTLPIRCFESDINLFNIVANQIGPESFNDPEMIAKTKPFDFSWSYGINSKLGLINLTAEYRREIFFASSHLPILYNYCTKQMKCLEGHQYLISSISADQTGQWLATADDNKDGCVIIWDSYDHMPVYTLFSIYSLSGTLLVKLSWSARYMITVGLRKEGSYSVDMWLWTLGRDNPEDSFEVDKSYGAPLEVCFNPNVEEFIMLIFKKQVFLLVWDTEKEKFTKSKIPRITNLSRTGILTTGCYVPDCHECYACSNKGCILVFGNTLYSKPFAEGNLDNSKIYINAIKVSEYALRSCSGTASALVVGDAIGSILFFDTTKKILYWLEKFPLTSIVSISFNSMPKFKHEDLQSIYIVKPSDSNVLECDFVDLTGELQRILKTNLPKDASLNSEPFLLPDFFVATSDNNVYAIDFLHKKCVPIFLSADDCVSAIEVHDELPYIIIGYSNGKLHLVDYDKNEVVCSAQLPKTEDSSSISSLKYSPGSIHLICGRENGEIWVLEPILLQPKDDMPFRPAKYKIMKIVFSKNKAQFAYYDNNQTVALFVFNVRTCNWAFTGKIRSHYKDINDIIFMPHHHTSILYTIGCDRHLVEYNNNEAQDRDFSIACRERIEQRAVPMSFLYWYEMVKDREVGYLLIADNEHKFKLLDPETKIPKSVILAPAFGCFKNQIINKMMIVPKTEAQYMLFLANKYIGLHILMPDGNPYKYVGYLGHPSKVVDFHTSLNGKYMFSFGLEDHCVFKWKIKTKAVELMHLLGGKELEPFYCLIEGGKNGWLFQEIKDLFYYMQILQHESMDYPRKVSDTVNITELPELVRTCGFYPTEFELENMMIDIKYRNFNETSTLNTEVNFIDFVKLFCNHKPVYGYTKEILKKAFTTIIMNSDSISETEISREDFASVLAYSGEFISPANLLKFLKTLLRSDNNDGSLEFLPEDITFDFLYEDLFGIDMIRTTVTGEPETTSYSNASGVLQYN